MADFWTEEREDELVILWQERPCLYNPALKTHSNRAALLRARTEIGTALGTTGKLTSNGVKGNVLMTCFMVLDLIIVTVTQS